MAKKQEFDIHGKTGDELKDTLLDLKKQQFNLRFPAQPGRAGQHGVSAPRAPEHRPHADGDEPDGSGNAGESRAESEESESRERCSGQEETGG